METQIDLSRQPLKLIPDHEERWINFKDKDGVTFDAAADEVLNSAHRDGLRTDFGVSDLATWFFGPMPDGTAAITPAPVPGRAQPLIPLRQHAFRQLCTRAGAPSGYIEKLPAKLQIACVNHGMQRGDADGKAATVRLAGGSARAIVSDRYAALDDERVLDVMRSTLVRAGKLDDCRVRAVAVGPTTALRLVFPEHSAIVRSPQLNDIVEVGLDITNGEVGNRSISLTPSTFRLVCLNGMRRQHKDVASRLRHTGDPNRLLEAFADALPVALAGGQQLRAKMAQAVDNVIDDVLAEFEGLSAFGLRAHEVRDVTRAAFPGLALPADTSSWGATLEALNNNVSQYDVANALTHYAQTRDTDRRLDIEETAAQYLYRRAS